MSAPRSRQITTPASHHSAVYRPDPFLPPNQQHQSTEGLMLNRKEKEEQEERKKTRGSKTETETEN